MNEQQFKIIAKKVLRKPEQIAAAYDVIFNNLTKYEAERKYNCTPNTVGHSVIAVKRHYHHCIQVANAE